MTFSDNMRGAALMTGSMVAFTVNDACMKALSDELPLFQALLLRGIGVSLCLALLLWWQGRGRGRGQAPGPGVLRRLAPRDRRLVLLRTGAEILAAYLFLSALFNMPIANVTAILQALPLTVTLAGALFLGEAVGWRRLTAILVGFLGVLMVVRPGGEGFNIHSLYVLGAVCAVTVRDLAARRLSAEVPSILVALAAALGVTLAAGVASAFVEWGRPSGLAWAQLAGATGFILGGYVFSVAAMRVGEIGFVAPFRYAGLVAALILGLVVFAEWPEPLTLAGAALIVGTGLFTLARERRQRRRVAARASAALGPVGLRPR